MLNEKVSQMTALTAAEIAPEDIFLVGDISARESKQVSSSELLLFIESSGSFPDPTLVDSASYASYAATVRSASYSDRTISASHALRSNFSDTASYFSSSFASVESASYANKASTADSSSFSATSMNAVNASNLVYIGSPNGTASFAISASTAQSSSNSVSASYAYSASNAITSSFTISSSFANASLSTVTSSYALAFNNPVKGWAMVTWSYGGLYSQPQLYMNNNIASVTFNRTFTHTNWAWFMYDITFSVNLPSTNYMAVGQTFSPYLAPEKQDFIFDPVYSNRSTSSCTVAIAVDTATYSITAAAFFAGVSASFPSGDTTYMTFQILGT